MRGYYDAASVGEGTDLFPLGDGEPLDVLSPVDGGDEERGPSCGRLARDRERERRRSSHCSGGGGHRAAEAETGRAGEECQATSSAAEHAQAQIERCRERTVDARSAVG